MKISVKPKRNGQSEHAANARRRRGSACADIPRRADASARHSPLSSLLSPLLLLLCLAGCSRSLDTIYGQRQGSGAKDSVNGTAVLGEMFEHAGHRVSSWGVLSPRLHNKADCIVWFPNDFRPPSKEVCEWLEKWLEAEPGRTLIYVGRDYDAAPWYWRHVLPQAASEQRQLAQDELSAAEREYSYQRRKIAKSKSCRWFTIDSTPPNRHVQKLTGETVWTHGIDAAKTDIDLRSRIAPKDADALLRSGEDVLVSRRRYDDSQLIVVANGAFLLNLPLVNHQHRKLAGKLIAAVGDSGQTVVFLESDSHGPPIRDKDPTPEAVNGWIVFNRWPTNWILLQLAVVGILFCFARWPIFGRARTPAPPSSSDFARHIEALAELMKRSRDRAYAMERILNYRQKAERDK